VTQEKQRASGTLQSQMKTPTMLKNALREKNTTRAAKRKWTKAKTYVAAGTSKRQNTIKNYESTSSNELAGESSEPTSSISPAMSDISGTVRERAPDSTVHIFKTTKSRSKRSHAYNDETDRLRSKKRAKLN